MGIRDFVLRVCGAKKDFDRLTARLAERDNQVTAMENSLHRVYRAIGISYDVSSPETVTDALALLRSTRRTPATKTAQTVFLGDAAALAEAVEDFLLTVDGATVMCSCCGHLEDADEIEGIDDLRNALIKKATA